MSFEGTGQARRVAILAGGASSRMGVPKAAIELGGRPLIEYPLEAARAAGLEPFVVAKRASVLPLLDCPLVEEPAFPRHPLVGVIAALEYAGGAIVVLPCDAPLVPAGLIAELAGAEATFAMPVDPRPQPLVARYAPSLLPRLRAGLDRGESMSDVAVGLGGELLNDGDLRRHGDPAWLFANVNDQASLTRVASELRRRRGAA